MNQVAIIQHSALQSPMRILDWLNTREISAKLYCLDQAADLPELASFDLLVLLGGPMNVDQQADYPWLSAEQALISQAIASGKRLLGFGLGSQLLAQALGAQVTPLERWQIGWLALEKSPNANASPLGRMLAQRLMPMHWQSQGFSLPEGAIALYEGPNDLAQSFVWDERVVGLQFHLECTPLSIHRWLENTPKTLLGDQTAEQIHALDEDALLSSALREPLYRILDYLSGPHAQLC